VPLAKLSERFYQKFGHELVEELVTWLNQMDTTYRTDLRELNELNFSRFDSKLEQRTVELESRIDHVAAQLDAKIDHVAAQLDAKIDRVAAQLVAKIDRVAAQLDAKIDGAAAGLRQGMGNLRAGLIKWMFVFWIGQAATTIALVFVVTRHP